jgi:hypothetical protein
MSIRDHDNRLPDTVEQPYSLSADLADIGRSRVAEIRAESPRRKATDRAASITGELMARPQYKYVDGALLADLVRDTLALYGEG